MKLESVSLKGFRCFGPDGERIDLDHSVTALVGGNGAGKTALMQALSRLFGVTASQRRVIRRDFHQPLDQAEIQSGATLSIDAVFAFPELAELGDDEIGDAVAEFFMQMAASGVGEPIKVRIMLKATWTDDGTPGGSVEEDMRYVRALGDDYDWEDDCQKVPAIERGTIQLVYVPATRNVQEQVTALLKGRLWRAARWSEPFRKATAEKAQEIQDAFQAEDPATFVLEKLQARWEQVHEADTDTTVTLRLVERRFEEFVRKADFAFFPDEAGHERRLTDLSDGQRSLFHIALTAATLEAERDAIALPAGESAFDQEKLPRAHLTLLAIEEPENSLSPFFLSRIITQAREIGELDTAQVVLSSHSAGILSRIEAEQVRYFRLDRHSRQSSIRRLTLPAGDEEASRYVRLAVRAYPELYFARFVILAEGTSEQLVIPRIADALGVRLDPSFVPVVPLGGRYCAHFWRLLSKLQIPHATLLDFDIGRRHGGAHLVRDVAGRLEKFGVDLSDTSLASNGSIDLEAIDDLDDETLRVSYQDCHWVKALEKVGIFLSAPLDLDFSMLEAFPHAYRRPHLGGRGPRDGADALQTAKRATLKAGGDAALYDADGRYDDLFRWYPYLFLRRSKPETHLTAIARLTAEELAKKAPAPLASLIEHVKGKLDHDQDDE